MAVNRFYSSTATETTLTGGISNSDTTIVVASVSGFPVSYPYTLVIDKDTTDEEIVTVSAASGLTLTLSTRGADGSLATSHSAAATVTHMATARDFREPQEHIAASQDVHGIGSGASVVGTTTTQTLTHKTLDAAANTIAGLLQSHISGLVAALAAKAVDAEVVKLAGTQTVTGAKNFTGGLSYNGTSLVPTPAVPLYSGATGTTGGTAYVNALPSGQFVAPPSGLVIVHISAKMGNSTGDRCWFGFKVYAGVSASGTPFQDVADDRAIGHSGNTFDSFGRAVPVDNLTPGATYTIIGAARVTAGVGTYDDRRIIVVPAN